MPSLDAALGGNRPVTVHEVFAQVDPALELAGRRATSPPNAACRSWSRASQTHEDASLALDHGAAGVIVSNHGGRQLDCVGATADILPEVVEAVDGRGDGAGRRRASAAARMCWSPWRSAPTRCSPAGPPLWGLAAGGAEGARRVLELLRAELELALTLCGCASPAEMGRPHVRRAPV